MHIILYTRPNCSLCDDAKRTLQLVQDDVSFTMEEVNIESSHALHEQWMLLIPAVVHDGVLIQHGIVDYVTIEEALQEIARKRDN